MERVPGAASVHTYRLNGLDEKFAPRSHIASTWFNAGAARVHVPTGLLRGALDTAERRIDFVDEGGEGFFESEASQGVSTTRPRRRQEPPRRVEPTHVPMAVRGDLDNQPAAGTDENPAPDGLCASDGFRFRSAGACNTTIPDSIPVSLPPVRRCHRLPGRRSEERMLVRSPRIRNSAADRVKLVEQRRTRDRDAQYAVRALDFERDHSRRCKHR